MRAFSFLSLFFLLTMQMPSVAFAQSFGSTKMTFEPEVYGLSEDYREMPFLRTSKTLTFVKPNGQFVSIGSQQELFTHDNQGHLVPIEETGKKTAEGIVFDRLPKDVSVVFDNNEPAYVYRQGDHWFRLSYAGTAAAELESPNIIRYRLTDHAVLHFEVHGSTVSKRIVINGPADPSALRFSLIADPSLTVHLSESGMLLSDSAGTPVFEAAAPTLEDIHRTILETPITVTPLGKGLFEYTYDPTGLPTPYVIDPSTRVRSSSTAISVSTGDTPWSNPANIDTSDDVYASASTIYSTDKLQATNLGFRSPDPSATIQGIQVFIERFNANPLVEIDDDNVQIIKGGTAQGLNQADGIAWPTSDAVQTFGGMSDLWELSLTANDINSNDFGLELKSKCRTMNCEGGGDGNAEFRVDQITIQVFGTLSAGYLDYVDNFSNYWDNVCRLNSLEAEGCWCGYCSGFTLPSGISAVDAFNESVDLTLAGVSGGKLVRFKKGSARIADVPMFFESGEPDCDSLTMDTDATLRQSFIHGLTDYFSGSNSGYLLYVPKSVSDDNVRVCSGKDSLGCTTGNGWSFLANDSGTITETNGGFSTKDITVSVAEGYWFVYGMNETGGEGEDGGGGGTPVPELPMIGLLAILVGGTFFIRRKLIKIS